MADNTKRAAAYAASLLGLAAGLVAIGSTVEMASAGQNGSQGVRCEIRVNGRGSGVSLQGVVHADAAVQGTYQFRVSKSAGAGSSDINQSGGFSVSARSSDELGAVTLGGDSGSSYVAKLKVTWAGGSVECTERVRGTL